jgi:hypothetical protein
MGVRVCVPVTAGLLLWPSLLPGSCHHGQPPQLCFSLLFLDWACPSFGAFCILTFPPSDGNQLSYEITVDLQFALAVIVHLEEVWIPQHQRWSSAKEQARKHSYQRTEQTEGGRQCRVADCTEGFRGSNPAPWSGMVSACPSVPLTWSEQPPGVSFMCYFSQNHGLPFCSHSAPLAQGHSERPGQTSKGMCSTDR